MIPEYKWTKNQKDFVGTHFPTPKGGTLTVVGVRGKDNKGAAIFTLECSICSKDAEVWPYGSINSVKSNLLQSKSPCGCAQNPYYTEEQDIILTQRIVDKYHKNLKVVGVNGLKASDKRFTLVCNICSKDKDLFPLGSIISYKGSLQSGTLPCGCSKKYNWSEEQYMIRIKRECEKRGYKFLGFNINKGCKVSSDTLIKLYNNATGNSWDTTNISNFFQGQGDPIAGRKRADSARRLEDIEHINNFMNTGSFAEGTKFEKIGVFGTSDYAYYWNYTCPICSNDEFVKAGVCSGIFTARQSNLQKGFVSCRCAKNYKYSKEQREYQVEKICKEDGLTFIRWEGSYKSNRSKLIWLCKDGHKCSSTLSDFMVGKRCNTCFKIKQRENGIGYGYYPDRVDEKDYLYIMNFNNKYIKVGRAFNIEKRLNKTKSGLIDLSEIPREDIKILQVLTSNHQTVYNSEQWLHTQLRGQGFEYNGPDGLWSIELFDMDSLPVLDYLLKGTELVEVSDEFRD